MNMTILQEIQSMYEKRVEKKELTRMPTETTMKKHSRNLEKLSEHLTGKVPTLIGNMNWMIDDDPEEVISKMKTMKGRGPQGETIGLSSQQSYMFSILVGVRVMDFDNYHNNKLYSLVYDTVNDKKGFKKQLDSHKTNKDNVFVPEYNEVQKIVDKFISEGDDLDFNIILKIYTTYPFRLEVADLKYLATLHKYKSEMSKEKKGNYIVKKSRPRNSFMFSFNDYKTYNVYGERKIDIKDKTLLNLLRMKQMDGGEFLFGENGMLRNTLSKKITLFFEKNGIEGVNPTNLTKMVIKKTYDEMDTGLREKQEELAAQRGHSVSTQMMIYLTD
jgi:hypothetical protein